MHYSKEEKLMWLEDWKQSGKTAWAYGKENGILPQTFCGWVKREGKTAQGFVELPVRIKPNLELQQEILVEKGELKIHIPLSAWMSYSRTILEGLQAI